MVTFSRVYINKLKGFNKLSSLLQPLAHQIDIVKGKLYLTIEDKKNLNNKEVYLLSTKLDELINKYQTSINQNSDIIV